QQNPQLPNPTNLSIMSRSRVSYAFAPHPSHMGLGSRLANSRRLKLVRILQEGFTRVKNLNWPWSSAYFGLASSVSLNSSRELFPVWHSVACEHQILSNAVPRSH